MDKPELICESCGKTYKTNGPFEKHIVNCGKVNKENEIPESETDSPISWVDYEPEIEDGITEHLPSPLHYVEKLASKKPKKRYNAKELKEIQRANIVLLKMGLGATDFFITKYGQAVTEDRDYECRHSDADKTMVANAQNAWLEEKGVNISQHIGKGKIATLMTGYYIVPPVIKINRRKTRRIIKKGILISIQKKIQSGLKRFRFRRRRSDKNDESPAE